MALSQKQMLEGVQRLIYDTDEESGDGYTQKVSEELLKDRVNVAIARYSKDRPLRAIYEVAGDGSTYDLAVPTGWTEGFSQVLSIEYPADERVATYLEEKDWVIFRKIVATVETSYIRLINHTPASGQSVRIIWAKPHTLNGSTSTIYSEDELAVQQLAAAGCCTALANQAAGNSDSSINADSTNYRDSQLRYSQQSKALMADYFRHMGIDPDSPIPASSISSDIDTDPSWRGSYLTHNRRNR